MSSSNIYEDITAIVLAGGQGKRLGNVDKGLLEYKTHRYIDICLQKLQKYHRNILVSTNSQEDAYRSRQHPLIPDTKNESQGPLSGLLSCAPLVSTTLTLVVPVDAPFFPEDYSQRMYNAYNNSHQTCVVYDGQRNQNLFILFETDLFKNMQNYYDSGNRSVKNWLQGQPCQFVDFSDMSEAFLNVNTPQELQSVSKKL